jgi:hypothetical protein
MVSTIVRRNARLLFPLGGSPNMVSTIVRRNARLLFPPSGYFSLKRPGSDNYCHLYVSRTVR